MSKILDFVPDVIRDAAIRDGVENVYADPTVKSTMGSMPLPLKQAYAEGDYNTIRDYDNKAANDMNPIFLNMKEHAEKAFVKLRNESDDREYYMSFSGTRDNPTGYYWIYCPDVTNQKTRAVEVAGQIGTYSVNSKTLGISNMIWTNTWTNVTASTLAALLVGFAARFAFNRISGMIIEAAAEAAAAATGEALIAAGIISSAFWATVAGAAAAVIVGAIVGAAAYFLVQFIIDFMIRDYWVGVSIYNWDVDNSYKVTQYHSDNSTWSGGGEFKEIELEIPGNTMRMPDGTIKPTLGTIYSYATYILKNNKTLFQGLGVGFRVESKDGSTGFQCAYECPRFGGNRLALLGGFDKSLDNFYNQKNNWAAGGSYKTKSFIPNSNVPILCTTDALNGRDDHFYRLDVHIGLKPTDGFVDPLPPAPEEPLRPEPAKPKVPHAGQELTLPNGDRVPVLTHGAY